MFMIFNFLLLFVVMFEFGKDKNKIWINKKKFFISGYPKYDVDKKIWSIYKIVVFLHRFREYGKIVYGPLAQLVRAADS